MWPSIINDFKDVFSGISKSFLKSWAEAVHFPSCYLDMSVMAGTLATISEDCETLVVKALWSIAWASDTNIRSALDFYVREKCLV